MLAYNVDLLLLPPEAGAQTQFYCTFASKSRMAIGGCARQCARGGTAWYSTA